MATDLPSTSKKKNQSPSLFELLKKMTQETIEKSCKKISNSENVIKKTHGLKKFKIPKKKSLLSEEKLSLLHDEVTSPLLKGKSQSSKTVNSKLLKTEVRICSSNKNDNLITLEKNDKHNLPSKKSELIDQRMIRESKNEKSVKLLKNKEKSPNKRKSPKSESKYKIFGRQKTLSPKKRIKNNEKIPLIDTSLHNPIIKRKVLKSNKNYLKNVIQHNDISTSGLVKNDLFIKHSNINLSDSQNNPFQYNYSEAQHSKFNCAEKFLYIVIDTNILIHDLELVKSITGQMFHNKLIVIIIPNAVLKELDKLKLGNLRKPCQLAVNWINKELVNLSETTFCQSVIHERKASIEFTGLTADERIRDCCLKLKKEHLIVNVWSNDINLVNNCLANGIKSISSQLIQEVLQGNSGAISKYIKVDNSVKEDCYNDNNNKTNFEPSYFDVKEIAPTNVDKKTDDYLETKEKLRTTLSKILRDVMISTYGDVWETIIKIKPPWTLEDVIKCWIKHWIAIFSDKFNSKIQNLILSLESANSIENCDELSSLQKELFLHLSKSSYSEYVGDNSTLNMEISPVRSSSMAKTASINNPDSTRFSNVAKSFSTSYPDSISLSSVAKASSTNIIYSSNSNSSEIQNRIYICSLLDKIKEQIYIFSVEISNFTSNQSAINNLGDFLNSLKELKNSIESIGHSIYQCRSSKQMQDYKNLIHLILQFWTKAKIECPTTLPSPEEFGQFFATVKDDFIDRYLNLLAEFILQLGNLIEHFSGEFSME